MNKSINLMSPINGSGYGAVGTGFLKYLDKNEFDVALFELGGNLEYPMEMSKVCQKALNRAKSFDRNSPCLKLWHEFDLATSVGSGQKLAWTFFETTKLREVAVNHINCLDRIIVSSRWAALVLQNNGVKTDIKIIHPGVDTEIFNTDVEPININKKNEDTTVFLNIGKWEYRKGHDFLIKAFNAAFEPSDNVMLIMHCFNWLKFPGVDGPSLSAEWSQFYMNTKMGKAGKIKIVDGRLPTQHEVASLIQTADCGFFPSRAEGWNMPLSEMMAMGKNIIATDYSAHCDFCDPSTTNLIQIDSYEKAYDGIFFTEDVGEWASLGQKQLEQAVHYLRLNHKQKNIIKEFSWNQTVRDIECLL